MIRTAFIAALFWSAFQSPAMACPSAEVLSDREVESLRDVMTSRTADELDAVFAYERLACAARPGVRTLSHQDALRSSIETLKTVAAGALLRERDMLTLRLSADDKTSALARRTVEARPLLVLDLAPAELARADDRVLSGPCRGRLSYAQRAVDLRAACADGRAVAGRLVFDGRSFSGELSLSHAGEDAGRIWGSAGLLP